MTGELAGRVALVTGGTKGIGRAVSVRLAEAGADVAVAARGAETAQPVVDEIRALGRHAEFFPVDLVDYDSVEAMTGEAVARFGHLEVVVASGAGGRAFPRLFLDTDPHSIPAYFEGTIFARLYTAAATLPHLRERGYGKVVFVTTDAGRVPTPAESLIGSAAAGVLFMVRALAREVARHGIRVNAVSTTLTKDTPPWERWTRDHQGGSTEVLDKAFEKIARRVPFGINEPRDVAEAVRFLASPASDQVTGAILSVNGGISFPG
jgi:3-oxoacyl-[acyl-carrier protein] reductase